MRIVTIVAMTVLYARALASPAFFFEGAPPETGLDVLAWGWWGFLLLNPAWGANVLGLLVVVALVIGNVRAARSLGAAAVAVSLFAFRADEWWFSEANATPIIGRGDGFWCWLACFAAGLAGALASQPSKRYAPKPEPPGRSWTGPAPWDRPRPPRK